MEPEEINNINLFKNLREFFNKEIIVWGLGCHRRNNTKIVFV